jgi:hypothetical protein
MAPAVSETRLNNQRPILDKLVSLRDGQLVYVHYLAMLRGLLPFLLNRQ